MELKEQIEQLEKDFNNRIQELKNKINKPKIEVGKVYKSNGYSEIIGLVTRIEGEKCFFYGFDYKGNYVNEDFFNKEAVSLKYVIEATTEEWTTALTRYCDELYKDCDRVDRSGLDIRLHGFENITKLDHVNNGFDKDGFLYKGRYVMDKHGKFAKGLKAEVKEMFVNVYNDNDVSWIFNSEKEAKESALANKNDIIGTFRFVRVD